MDFSKLSASRKLILAGGGIAVLSLFFHWAGWGLMEFSGFQYRGYFVLASFIYPVYMVCKGKEFKKKTAIISLSSGFAIMFFISILFKADIQLPGIYSMFGQKMIVVAILTSLVGVFMENEHSTTTIKAENN